MFSMASSAISIIGWVTRVFLILHDPDQDLTLWQKVARHLVKTTETGWSMVVPAANILSAQSKNAFGTGIANDL
jgi:hypothetical protein